MIISHNHLIVNRFSKIFYFFGAERLDGIFLPYSCFPKALFLTPTQCGTV
nr:MAG TPA: hypothetical protein [Caudoviricetes sp.]